MKRTSHCKAFAMEIACYEYENRFIENPIRFQFPLNWLNGFALLREFFIAAFPSDFSRDSRVVVALLGKCSIVKKILRERNAQH